MGAPGLESTTSVSGGYASLELLNHIPVWIPRDYSARISSDRHLLSARDAMILSGESLLVILLVGLVAGWLAGKIVTGLGFGLIGNIAIGIVGALVGSWLFPRLGIHIGTGIINQIIAATVGAILVLFIIGLIRGDYPRRRFLRW
jgi:uncharacterized membrane protein YeaQ/YmgE (transglycosylase-associated protein family)